MAKPPFQISRFATGNVSCCCRCEEETGIWKWKWWWKQKWKRRWRTEMETLHQARVSNHWTGLTQTSVGQKLNVLIQLITCSWTWSGVFSSSQWRSKIMCICNEKIGKEQFSWTETNLKHIETELYNLEAHLLKYIKYAHDLDFYWLEERCLTRLRSK